MPKTMIKSTSNVENIDIKSAAKGAKARSDNLSSKINRKVKVSTKIASVNPVIESTWDAQPAKSLSRDSSSSTTISTKLSPGQVLGSALVKLNNFTFEPNDYSAGFE